MSEQETHDRNSGSLHGYLPLFFVGDRVLITCDDEGYSGKTGVIAAVFPSGRCQVSIGKRALLNLPPEGLKHEVFD